MVKAGLCLDLRDYGSLAPAHEALLARLVDEADQAYDQVIDGISRIHSENPDWWASIPASRNTYVSRVHHAIRWLYLLAELDRQGEFPDTIITDWPEFARVLEERCAGRCHIQVEVNVPSIFRRMFDWSHSMAYEARSMAYGLFSGRRAEAERILKNGQPLALLKSYVRQSAFDEGTFEDEFFPGLAETLSTSQPPQITRLPVWNDWSGLNRLIEQCRRSDQNFIIKEDFLGVDDYLFAFLHRFRVRGIATDSIDIGGWNIAPLIRYELKEFASANYVIDALLLYRFVMKARRLGINIHTVVSWYEGQPSDKAFLLGMAQFYSHVRNVGYLGAAPRRAYRSMFPTPGEVAAKTCPAALAVTGEAYIDMFRGLYGDNDLMVVPNFRAAKRPPMERSPNPSQVLVPLPAERSIAKSLMRTVLSAFDDPRHAGASICVKPHPTHNQAFIEMILGLDMCGMVTISRDQLDVGMGHAKIVVGVGSNAILEAALAGVPVVVDATKWWFCHEDPLPQGATLPNYHRCLTFAEFKNALLNVTQKNSVSNVPDTGLRKAYLYPLEREGTERLFPLSTLSSA